MTNVAVFTVGASDLQIRNLIEAISNFWKVVEKSSSIQNVIEGAKKKKFSYLLVIDHDAIGKENMKALENLGVEVIAFSNKMLLVNKLKEEVEKSKRSVKVKLS